MAARQVQRRLLALFAWSRPNLSLPTGPCWRHPLLSNSSFRNTAFLQRGIQSQAETITQLKQDVEKHEDGGLKGDSDSHTASSLTSSSGIFDVKSSFNLKTSPRHDAAMVFTCNVCNTRSLKTFSRESYDKGVVVAQCGGCNKLHLIADRLGWFGKPGSVEEFLAARGEEVKKGTPESLNLTLEDLAGSNA